MSKLVCVKCGASNSDDDRRCHQCRGALTASRRQTRMTLEEFVDLGYLQEVNRRFLHPMGLALGYERITASIVEPENVGRIRAMYVWQAEDPEGIEFGGFTPEEVERGVRIEGRFFAGLAARLEMLGWDIEPLARPKDGEE